MNAFSGAPDFGAKRELAFGLPAWTYRSKELLDLEYKRLILTSWQFACHVNQLRAQGDYVVLDLLRDSVIVMRDRKNELRAFQNVCRHRGARLLEGTGRCKATIVCPYHGWSYGLDGRLAGVPSRESFPGLQKEDYGLNEVDLEVFHGLVFVRIAGDGPSVKEMFGPYSDLLEPYRIEDMVPVGDIYSETWAANWKVGVDNNLESYHVPIGHPGYHRMLDNDLMGFINEHGVAGAKSTLRARPSSNWVERMYQELAPDAFMHLPEEVRSTWMFFTMPPNLGIDIYPDSIDVLQILPRTAETSQVHMPVFVRPGGGREERILQYLNGRINMQVTHEDRELSERVQLGLSAHGYTPGPLSAIESCILDFHDRIRKAIPATMLEEEPAAGTLAAVDAELQAESGTLAA
ncbi:phenylpropionate dioxygenase-like ring-hydroxylating dioxygenase large terminal subunit [Rhodoligotrophos appendicifer]|uniref:aromatic ring-hydroxylating oxygenase subunit alpha n=1 Tax=Rhodoligotrophos appendicifer TaxID=987056 RepID=UPI0011856A0F|nr:aromatic ring-hydroxylating dioxygenase subunit alpha [Rhodoligotrophos appendicifer]